MLRMWLASGDGSRENLRIGEDIAARMDGNGGWLCSWGIGLLADQIVKGVVK